MDWVTKEAIIETMADHQIITDWLNCGSYSQQELDLIDKPPLFDAIFRYMEHLKSDDQVETVMKFD